MNLDILQGKWHVLRGRIRSRWGRLTNDDLDRLEGGLEQLAGLVQQRYGLQREQAEQEAAEFFDSCEDLLETNGASEAEAEQR
ncbi:MAG TPA: CsbD family protein [Planctomycetota bacterium]|nr:CsbD family protein [Planctomycetota bacterium]